MTDSTPLPSLRIEVGACSIVGTVRAHNEDAACAVPEIGLVAVADGLGGHQAGEHASNLAIEVLQRRLREVHANGGEPSLEALFDAFEEANQRILQEAEEHPERAGMGTTLTAAIITGNRILLGHIGDSRAWRVRDGGVEQLTRDHTVIADQVREGRLTEDEAEQHPMRHVLSRCLGVNESIEVDLAEGDVATDDIYILASDGLTHGLSAREIGQIAQSSTDPREASETMVHNACERDGQDNITAAVLVCRED